MGVLRVILALLVVISHFNYDLFGLKLMPGYICVEMFFVISGYYMALILSSNKYIATINFYASRFLRLYPLFIFIAILTLLKTVLFEFITGKIVMTGMTYVYSPIWLKNISELSNFTMFGQDIFSLFHIDSHQTIDFFHGNYTIGTDKNGFSWGGELRSNGPAWSIGAEIWFYFLMPYLNKLSNKWMYTILFSSIALKLFMEIAHGYDTYFFFPTQLYLFLLGILAYRNRDIGFHKIKNQSIILLTSLIFFILGYKYLPFQDILRYTLPIILFLNINYIFKLTQNLDWDRKLGEFSYPIYISHMLILTTFSQLSDKLHLKLSASLKIIIIVTLVLFFSYVWVRFIDNFINKYRYKRLSYQNKTLVSNGQ